MEIIGSSFVQKKPPDEYYVIDLEASSKLLSKTYNLVLTANLAEIDLGASFNAKLVYAGVTSIKSVRFKLDIFDEHIETLLNYNKFLKKVIKLVKQIDLISLKLRYNQEKQSATLEVRPYAGAYIWLKFPPVFYPLQLMEKEIDALKKLVSVIFTQIKS